MVIERYERGSLVCILIYCSEELAPNDMVGVVSMRHVSNAYPGYYQAEGDAQPERELLMS
jgi:hypothetical protein